MKADRADKISFKHGNFLEFLSIYLLAFTGGMIAGFVQSFIACPADVVKCSMQMQFSWLPPKYKNSFDCFKQIYLS